MNELASVPDNEKLIESESASLTAIVAADVWFSSIVNEELDVNTGDEFSTILVTLTVISWVVELVPSVAVTVAV